MTKGFLIPPGTTVREALVIMRNNGRGAAFVVERAGTLIGALTPEIVRRGLMNGGTLEDRVSSIVDTSVPVVSPDSDVQVAFAGGTTLAVLPVVDASGSVVDIASRPGDILLPVAVPDVSHQELAYVSEAILSGWISSIGPYIETFESSFARSIGVKHAVAVSNGTVAIHLALEALGIGEGDEVIVPDLTFAATANVVFHSGATPVIVDVERESWGIDPEAIRKAITPRTKAIIPVHLYGLPCNLEAVLSIAKEHKLLVVEDCAEAQGATVSGRTVGSMGSIGSFSFYGNKVVTTGEGGMCVTDDRALNDRLRILRDHGMSKTKHYWHDVVGYNYRMTNLQAAVGTAQMEHIGEFLAWRRDLDGRYRKAFADIPHVQFPPARLPNRERTVWLVSILITNGRRDLYIATLRKLGIDTRRLFYPMSAMPPYVKYAKACPVSVELSEQGLNLPTHRGVTDEWIETMADAFRRTDL